MPALPGALRRQVKSIAGGNPAFPDIRMPPLMEDGQHENGVSFQKEVDSVGKPPEQTSSYVLSNRGKLQRRPDNPIEEAGQLSGEAIAQARPLVLVPEKGLPDIDPRLRPEE